MRCASTIFTAALASSAMAADFSFGPPVPSALPKGQTPIAVRLADLDGDKLLDALVTGRNWDGEPGTQGRVVLLKGAGDGTFAPWHEVFVDEGHAEDARIADLDGDGTMDLVVGVFGVTSRVATFRGKGGGAFDPPRYVTIERIPRGLCTVDTDGDGDLDVVQTNYESGSLSILRNDRGTLAGAGTVRLMRYLGGVPFPQEVTGVDVNGDALPDVVTTTIGGGRISVMKRTSPTEFAPTVDWKPTPVNGEIPAVIGSSIADFDGDGDVDVVLPVLLVTQSQQVISLRNDGTGAFGDQTVAPTPSAYFIWSSTPIDVDGDGKLDLAIGTAITGAVFFMRNETAGPSSPLVFTFQWPFTEYGFFVRDLVSGDVDNDGDSDVVGVEIAYGTVFTLLNTTGQGVANAESRPRKRAEPSRPAAMPVHVDLNRDGKVDAADVAKWLSDWDGRGHGEARR